MCNLSKGVYDRAVEKTTAENRSCSRVLQNLGMSDDNE